MMSCAELCTKLKKLKKFPNDPLFYRNFYLQIGCAHIFIGYAQILCISIFYKKTKSETISDAEVPSSAFFNYATG